MYIYIYMNMQISMYIYICIYMPQHLDSTRALNVNACHHDSKVWTAVPHVAVKRAVADIASRDHRADPCQVMPIWRPTSSKVAVKTSCNPCDGSLTRNV